MFGKVDRHLLGFFPGAGGKKPEVELDTGPPVVELSMLSQGAANVRFESHDGNKFPGGFGPAVDLWVDYYKLRLASAELYQRNIYARGTIRRLVTNIVNTGLGLECHPVTSVLGLEEGSLDDWTDEVENRFDVWAADPELCDFAGRRTFAELQTAAITEALVVGDVLCVIRTDRNGAPRIQLLPGDLIQSPDDDRGKGREIVHGVEIDKRTRRPIAYWVIQEDHTFERLAATGKNGRKLAWLIYGTDKRLDEVRGQPLVSLVAQSLKELDRYRDAAIRKAEVNSFLAMYVEKTDEGLGSRPLSGGAVRAGAVRGQPAGQGGPVSFASQDMIPGLVIDRLAPGETIKGHGSQGTDEKFGDFEQAIVAAMSWALELPPSILQLSFSSNYSASQAELNEFKMFLDIARKNFAAQLCVPVYQDWFTAEVLDNRIQAPGFLEAWRSIDRRERYTVTAWLASEWAGHVKPTTDIKKQMEGVQKQLAVGATNLDRVSREQTGTKYRSNIRKLKRELELAKIAGVPLSLGDEFDESREAQNEIRQTNDEERNEEE